MQRNLKPMASFAPSPLAGEGRGEGVVGVDSLRDPLTRSLTLAPSPARGEGLEGRRHV